MTENRVPCHCWNVGWRDYKLTKDNSGNVKGRVIHIEIVQESENPVYEPHIHSHTFRTLCVLVIVTFVQGDGFLPCVSAEGMSARLGYRYEVV